MLIGLLRQPGILLGLLFGITCGYQYHISPWITLTCFGAMLVVLLHGAFQRSSAAMHIAIITYIGVICGVMAMIVTNNLFGYPVL